MKNPFQWTMTAQDWIDRGRPRINKTTTIKKGNQTKITLWHHGYQSFCQVTIHYPQSKRRFGEMKRYAGEEAIAKAVEHGLLK